MRAWLTAMLSIALAVSSSAAGAHLLPAQNATLHIANGRAYVVYSAPVSAFDGIDYDGDRLLSGDELNRHKDYIAQAFTKRFSLRAAGGNAISPEFVWISSPETDLARPPPTTYVVIMTGFPLSGLVKDIRVNTDLFGRNAGEGEIALRATSGDDAEVAILSARAPSAVLFAGAWSAFFGFIQTGIEHILLGADHLLFLLTIVAGVTRWRYLAAAVTSFTIAHTATLSLAIFGLLKVAPSVVEPAIAASIVLMAAVNLRTSGGGAGHRLALVFACGLLHGLGFAGALGAMGIDAQHRIASLAGFNIGVECGQAMFLALVLGARKAFSLAFKDVFAVWWLRGVSLTAALAGSAMLFMRLAPLLAGLR